MEFTIWMEIFFSIMQKIMTLSKWFLKIPCDLREWFTPKCSPDGVGELHMGLRLEESPAEALQRVKPSSGDWTLNALINFISIFLTLTGTNQFAFTDIRRKCGLLQNICPAEGTLDFSSGYGLVYNGFGIFAWPERKEIFKLHLISLWFK